MAPYGHGVLSISAARWRSPATLRIRHAGVTSDSAEQARSIPGPVQDTATPATSGVLYLGIGVGVGGAILIAIILVGVLLVRKRAGHRRAVAEIEQHGEPVRPMRELDISDIPRPVSVARRTSLLPLHGRAGWGALSSNETIHQTESEPRVDKKKRNSISLPKRIRGGIQLKRLKHLSAIMESPRSRATKSPSPAMPELVMTPVKSRSSEKPGFRKTITLVHPAERGDDVFVVPGSPKPDVLPCFAIRSPGMYGASIANDDRPKPPRSVSVGALVPIPETAVPGHPARPNRPQMHARSISLGAPPSRPPSGPVPPLPVISPHRTNSDESNRQGMCISRMSSSSQDSASSSVLVTSPILTMRDDESKQIGSPSIEQLLEDDDTAQLKNVVNRQWQTPLNTGPRPMDMPHSGIESSAPLPRNHASIRSNIARYSNDSLDDRHVSLISTMSTDSGRNRLSIPQLATADRVSISRVSSYNSLNSAAGGAVQKITTPRKPSRQSSVSANGSPAERRKTSTDPTSVSREIQANAVLNTNTSSRHTSHSTQNSGRSSNGNPFQWDQSLPLTKPSALKGSPNSKGSKGHKRQNCVRISTLTPQILGPPPSRPTSPSIMCGIQEEGEDSQHQQTNVGGVRFVNNGRRLSRPPSANSLGHQHNLRVQTLRASLTPSSPTLSTWTAYQEQYQGHGGLPSQHSDSQLSVSPMARTGSRQSDRSSAFSIPSFPSPSKATLSGIQLSQPVPEFSLSRPSTDEPEGSSSPFALHMSSEDEEVLNGQQESEEITLASSPPLPTSKHEGYDPAWPVINIPAPQHNEYDPASPTWPEDSTETEPERSSTSYFPFAIAAGMQGPCSDDEHYHVSPRSRPTSYGGDMPDTPPCSPKTVPEGFKTLFGREDTTPAVIVAGPRINNVRATRSAEKLTSANASAIMATIPEDPVNVGFPSAVPVLAPPPETEPQTTPQGRRQRAASIAASHLRPLRQAPPPSLSIPFDSDVSVPSPLHIKQTSPQGPRSEPAKSVLKNAMALRRMNSEIDTTTRNSRRYTRLTREASPLLPWIGSTDPSESCYDLFDFDVASDTGAGAQDPYTSNPDDTYEPGRVKSALDEIDMTDLDRRLDGALAGFEAGPPSSASPSATVSRTSSVWEDGEKFWERRPDFSFAASSPPSGSNTTPTKKAAPYNGEAMLATPASRLQMPMVDALPPSSKSRSLYDSDGFLKT